MGAAVAFPNRQVVAVCGDGGFTMLMGEIATMVKYNLPIKVLVIFDIIKTVIADTVREVV